LTFALLYGSDNRNYHIVKIDMATGRLSDLTQEDIEQLVRQEKERQKWEANRLKVKETAEKLRSRDYGP
jgi:hypothetical protein